MSPNGLPQGSGCGADRIQAIRSSCRAPSTAAVADRQVLFTLYNHPRPDFLGFPRHSPFHGRELPKRIEARTHCPAGNLSPPHPLPCRSLVTLNSCVSQLRALSVARSSRAPARNFSGAGTYKDRSAGLNQGSHCE